MKHTQKAAIECELAKTISTDSNVQGLQIVKLLHKEYKIGGTRIEQF